MGWPGWWIRPSMLAAGCLALWLIEPAVAVEPVRQSRTVVSVWYRGLPAGVPRQADLDAIRKAGFTGVTWPLLHTTGALELRRMADRAGLQVVIRTESVALTPESALQADSHVDIVVPGTPIRLFPSLIWRAVAHGARIVSFDAGFPEGAGLVDASGQAASWVGPAAAITRPLVSNANLVEALAAGPAVRIDPPVDGLDVTLLDAGRSWVLVATNVTPPGTRPADTYVFLPQGVPPAEWLDLFDGSTISMLRQPTGARWHVVLGPGDVRVYVIGKGAP